MVIGRFTAIVVTVESLGFFKQVERGVTLQVVTDHLCFDVFWMDGKGVPQPMCANPRMRAEMLHTLADEVELAPWRGSDRLKRRPVGRRAVMASFAIVAIPALAIALFLVAAT